MPRIDPTRRKALTESVNAHLAANNLTNTAFSRLSGLQMDAVARLKSGSYTKLTKPTIVRIERALGKSFAELAGPDRGGNGDGKPEKATRKKRKARARADKLPLVPQVEQRATAASLFTLILDGVTVRVPVRQRITVLGPRMIRLDSDGD